MRLRGYTDAEDWHPLTLASLLADRRAWSCGITPYEWRLAFGYLWYDGPLFQLRVGPFWVLLGYA